MKRTPNASVNENDKLIPSPDEVEEILQNLQSKTINYKNYVPVDEVRKIPCKLLLSSVNARSLLKNGEKIKEYVNTSKTDILCLQEVWKNDYKQDGYTLYQTERRDKRGGGVGILIRDTIPHELIKSSIKPDVEFIQIKAGKNYISSVYLPPMAVARTAFEHLENEIMTKKGTHYVMGDFNINMAEDNSLNEKSGTELMHAFCKGNMLLPLIRNPTRITQKSATIIDNILTNTKEHVTAGVVTTSIADHFTTFVAVRDKKTVRKEKNKGIIHEKIKIRVKKPENMRTFEQKLKETNWREMNNHVTPTQKTEYFQKQVEKAFNESFPMKEVKLNKNIHALEEWVTRGILISRVTLNKLSQKWAKTRNPIIHEEYTRYKAILQSVTRKSKEMTYGEIYQNNYKDSKKIWEMTNKLLDRKQRSRSEKLKIMHNGSITENSKEIANILNEHFVNMGKNIADSFEKNENFMKHMGPRAKQEFVLLPITPEVTKDIIKKMKSKSSSGFDNISNKLIKTVKEVIAAPITEIINSSILQGKVPDQWKLAKVILLWRLRWALF